MNENRTTEIIDEEIIEENKQIENSEVVKQEISSKEIARDELFEKMKIALLDETRLLIKLHNFTDEYDEFDHDETGLTFEEAEDLLRKANKIKEKLVLSLEEKLSIKFYDIFLDTINVLLILNVKYEEESFKIILELFDDSFDLEIL